MNKPFSFFCGLAVLTLPVLVASWSAQTSNQSTTDRPAVIAAVAPGFPPIARSAHAQGDVVVEVKVNSHGEVETSKAVSGHPLLQYASNIAAKKWKFAPADQQFREARLLFSFGYIDGGKSEPEYTITFRPPYKVEVIWNSLP